MNCCDFEQLVDPFLDGELSGTLRLEFDTHRLRCPLCQQKLAMMEACEHVLAREDHTPAISDDFSDRVMAAIAARQPAPAALGERIRLRLHLPNLPVSRRLLVPLQGAAAAVFILAIYATWVAGPSPTRPDSHASMAVAPGAPRAPLASGEWSPLRRFTDVKLAVLNDLDGVRRFVTDATVSDELTRMLTEDPFTRFLSLIVPTPTDDDANPQPERERYSL